MSYTFTWRDFAEGSTVTFQTRACVTIVFIITSCAVFTSIIDTIILGNVTKPSRHALGADAAEVADLIDAEMVATW